MSSIDQGLVVIGDIFGEDNLVIKGIVKGSVFLQNKNLQIDATGHVEGEVRAEKIVVAGDVLGDITAEAFLQLMSTAKVTGDIRTAKLGMEDGSSFTGGLSIQEPESVELEVRDYKQLSEEDYEKLRKWRMRNHVE